MYCIITVYMWLALMGCGWAAITLIAFVNIFIGLRPGPVEVFCHKFTGIVNLIILRGATVSAPFLLIWVIIDPIAPECFGVNSLPLGILGIFSAFAMVMGPLYLVLYLIMRLENFLSRNDNKQPTG